MPTVEWRRATAPELPRLTGAAPTQRPWRPRAYPDRRRADPPAP
ncbi:hypothetical protein FM103_11400 [Corynebacterium xerosis]|nr:hypothetical protein FM103_11400 [Corynebacterium xerosis]